MVELRFRSATSADIKRYYGKPQRMTLQAVVVVERDEPIGIIGLARQGHVARFFSEFQEELRPYLKTIPVLRAIKAAMEFVKDARVPVYALAQCDEETSHAILRRLGFVQDASNPEVYTWPS